MDSKEPFRIRQETPADYPAVYNLVRRSFATVDYADGDEQEYLGRLRGSDGFIPELSLVAEGSKGRVLGQIVLYKTEITTGTGKITELCLSPLSVDPERFRKGIARALTDAACEIARSIGYSAVFLCGSPEIYRKLGFLPTYQFGIRHARDDTGSAEWSMVRELKAGALKNITGRIDIV